jgi:uncharacterized protein
VLRLLLVLALAALSSSATALPPPETAPPSWGALSLLGASIEPGTRRRVDLRASQSFAGARLSIPVFVVRGGAPGPTLCLTGAVHGDELNGVEIVRRVVHEVEPDALAGTLIGVPIANRHGFQRSSRYLPDRRDLNRHFPGRARGSSASRIARALFEGVVLHCDGLVDFHTGSFHRTNLPHLRAALQDPATLALAEGFGGIVVHSVGQEGTLRRAATDAGIAAVTYEGGEPMRLQEDEVQLGVRGVHRLLQRLGMVREETDAAPPEIYRRSMWVRVDHGGILLAGVELGDRVEPGDILGWVSEPLSGTRAAVYAPTQGRVVGMALNQVVIPGFAAFHLGLQTGPGDEAPSSSLEDMGPLPPDAGAAVGEALDIDERPE